MASIEFLRPRLHGHRFDGGQIPMEVLGDLIALRDMVMDVAKWRFLQENPHRQRVPRGFAESVTLSLSRLEEGSAVPVISLVSAQSTTHGWSLPYEHYFGLALDDIADAIGGAWQNGQREGNEPLPRRYLAYFDKIGRSLRDEEYMELPTPRRTDPARLTKESRQRLVEISRIRQYTGSVTLRGFVSEVDQDEMTFELQPIYGRKITGPVPEQHLDTIMDAFNDYRTGARVAVYGIGRFSQQNRLSNLESVEHVDLLDALDVSARLDEFRLLQDGWLDGIGLAPTHRGLDWFVTDFGLYYPSDAPTPYTYPTPEGGIQLEWSMGSQEVSLNVNLDTRVAVWHRLDVSDLSDSGQEQEINLDDVSDWDWLGQEVLRISEETP